MSPPAEPTDRELWRRAVEGEPECFGLIFDRHSRPVHAYCARRTGSPDAADDLTSIVFLEAWRRRTEIDLHDESALPWLFGVANRVVQHRFRTTMRHRAALSRLPAHTATPDHADDVAARIDGDRRLSRVKAAFDRLTPADQDVLALCVWQGLDYATAAIALGVPIGTVRSRLSRARGRLQALAGDAIPDEEAEPSAQILVPIRPTALELP